jgi:hypothetical protein
VPSCAQSSSVQPDGARGNPLRSLLVNCPPRDSGYAYLNDLGAPTDQARTIHGSKYPAIWYRR